MTASTVLRLAGDVGAARQARAFVRETLGRSLDGDLLADVLLVASELVSNAVMHAGTASVLELRQGDGVLEVRLSDGDPRAPVRRVLVGGLAEQGRGLALLSALTERWGVDQRADGKTVWAVVRTG